MSKTVQHKGGSTVQNDSYTGAAREITVDTTKNTLRVHDGVTPGGTELARISDLVSSVYTAGDGLTLTGVDFRVNAGAGVAISSDNVVIDLYPSSGLMTTVDGTAPSSSTNAQLSLTRTGVAAGTYRSLTVDAYGRITAGTNPTTLAGYGILDAQPLDADLTSIAGLAGTNGLLRKTAANTWALDTAAYLPVTITAPQIGDSIFYNGTQWVNLGNQGDQTNGGSIAKRIWSANIPSASGTTTYTPGTATPLTTDGSLVWSLTVTPQSTQSSYVIQTSLSGAASTNNANISLLLFRNGVYLGGTVQIANSSNNSATLTLNITDRPNTTSPVTYQVRVGVSTGTWYINRRNVENTYGGLNNGWVIWEY